MKHRVAIAAATLLASSSAAVAQSSVTIFGRIDLGLFHQNGGNSPIAPGNNRVVGGVPVGASSTELRDGSAGRIGFRGTEDLGGGLSTNFVVESRHAFDTGTANTPFFQARTFVELASKTVGSVYLGREYFPAFWVGLRVDPWGFDSVGSHGLKHAFAEFGVNPSLAASPENHRSNNTIGYKSPSFNGFSFQAAHARGEGVRSDTNGANIEYRKGPIYAGAGFERVTPRQKVALIGGTYDFGFVRPGVMYTAATVNGVKRNNKLVTALVPAGPGVAKFGYAVLDPAGGNNNTKRVGIGYEYFLSKRTSILADLGSSRTEGLAGGKPYSRTTVYDLTIKHNF